MTIVIDGYSYNPDSRNENILRYLINLDLKEPQYKMENIFTI